MGWHVEMSRMSGLSKRSTNLLHDQNFGSYRVEVF